MPRPPLPIGTHSNVNTRQRPDGSFQAFARMRDHDGVTRKVQRNATTAAQAKKRLREHLRDRAQHGPATDLGGESRFREAAEQWIESVEQLVALGQRSPNTGTIYRLNLTVHVLPGIGELRLRELTVPRLDRFVQAVQLHHGGATAKIARTVVSGVLGLAVRHGAVPVNPVRDISRISTRTKRQPRALTIEERRKWVERLAANDDARRKDLPDLCTWMLATGVRIGEALAVAWHDIDLTTGTVAIDHTLVRVKGVGLVRKSTKSVAGERTLRLPRFAMGMLHRRALDSGRRGPLFPDSAGGWRDPSNTSRDLRQARGSEEFSWVTSHVFRKTAATEMDQAGLSARQIADQLGHSKVSMTQDRYLGRRAVTSDAANALDASYRLTVKADDATVSGG